LHNEIEQAWKNARMLKDLFGDRLFFELMPATVDRDYVKGDSIAVTDENGVTFRFMPDDVLVTDIGDMTAAEALARKPAEILFVRPNRVQDGAINSMSLTNTAITDIDVVIDPDPAPILEVQLYES
jgi:hypothetical protein